MIVTLSAEQGLFLHSRLVAETGGAHGVRDLSMLLSALGRPLASFGGSDLYPNLFSKAAALLDSLIRNHPFIDGNKRTAISAAGIFLRLNGYQLRVDPAEMVLFTLACAQSQIPLDQIEDWLRVHCVSE